MRCPGCGEAGFPNRAICTQPTQPFGGFDCLTCRVDLTAGRISVGLDAVNELCGFDEDVFCRERGIIHGGSPPARSEHRGAPLLGHVQDFVR